MCDKGGGSWFPAISRHRIATLPHGVRVCWPVGGSGDDGDVRMEAKIKVGSTAQVLSVAASDFRS